MSKHLKLTLLFLLVISCVWRHTDRYFSVSQSVCCYWQYHTARSKEKYHTARSKEKYNTARSKEKYNTRDIKGKISKLPINIIYFPSSQYLKHMLCIYEYIYWHRIVNICNIVFNFVIVRKIYIKCRVEKYSFIMLWITVFFGFAR